MQRRGIKVTVSVLVNQELSQLSLKVDSRPRLWCLYLLRGVRRWEGGDGRRAEMQICSLYVVYLYLCICVLVYLYLSKGVRRRQIHVRSGRRKTGRNENLYSVWFIFVFVYLCTCICVFGHPTLTQDQYQENASPYSSIFRWVALLLLKQQCHGLGPQGLTLCNKLYLCICVFVFVYLVTPHSHKTNIKKTPVRTLQFFRWAALLLLKQQCHGLGPQGLTLCNN